MDVLNVFVAIALLVELLGTMGALVRPFAGMHSNVSHHVAPARDHFAAIRPQAPKNGDVLVSKRVQLHDFLVGGGLQELLGLRLVVNLSLCFWFLFLNLGNSRNYFFF